MCPWCGQAFESGALERVAIAGEQAFKRNAYAMKRPYFVVPRANGEGNQKVDQAKRWVHSERV